jgi:hypothetical protein
MPIDAKNGNRTPGTRFAPRNPERTGSYHREHVALRRRLIKAGRGQACERCHQPGPTQMHHTRPENHPDAVICVCPPWPLHHRPTRKRQRSMTTYRTRLHRPEPAAHDHPGRGEVGCHARSRVLARMDSLGVSTLLGEKKLIAGLGSAETGFGGSLSSLIERGSRNVTAGVEGLHFVGGTIIEGGVQPGRVEPGDVFDDGEPVPRPGLSSS